MSTDSPRCPYLLVVDTTEYAGNFERQLTGFCTGVDDGTHGDLEGNDLREWLAANGKSVSFADISTTCLDDSDYPRVATCWPTPGRLNNGMGYAYDAGDPALAEDARLRAIESMRQYQQGQRDMIARRFAENDFEDDSKPGAWTREATERTLRGLDSGLANAGNFNGYPAYESVAIFLTAIPSDNDLDIFMERLDDFSKNRMEFGRRSGKPLTVKRVFLAERRGDEFVEIREIRA